MKFIPVRGRKEASMVCIVNTFRQHCHGKMDWPDMTAYSLIQIQKLKGSKALTEHMFFFFWHQNEVYPCALIQWYSYISSEPDTDNDGGPHLAVIHIEAIFCTVHLVPVFHTAHILGACSGSLLLLSTTCL